MRTLRIKARLKPAFLKALEDHDSFFVIRLQGDLDTHAIEQNHGKMTEVIEGLKLYSKPVLCDFDKVQHSDTATLAALIQRISEYRKQGGQKMVFFNVRGELLSLFEIAHLNSVFEIRGSEKEAVAALADFKSKTPRIR